MKTCGYCNTTYEDEKEKCPVCGSTMLKMDHSTSGEDEYDKIEAEIKKKRQTRSAIIIGIVVCVLIMLTVGIVALVRFINDPQRDIDKNAEQMYATAQEYVDAGDYEAALATADKINPQWSDYYQVDSLIAKAVKGQLSETIAEYEAEGNYEAVIKYIDENVEDISSDEEIEEIYNNSVSKYKEAVIDKADEYLSNKDYSAAVSVLTTAIRLVGSDKELDAKLFECNKAEILNQISIYKSEENYAKACEMIDMESFIDYYSAEIYMARTGDWPSANVALWRSRGISQKEYEDGKWRWMLFDVNTAALKEELTEHDTIAYVTEECELFANLSKNPQFRSAFSNRLREMRDVVFDVQLVNEKLDEYKVLMSDPMEKYFQRFFGMSNDEFHERRREIRTYAAERQNYIDTMLENNGFE